MSRLRFELLTHYIYISQGIKDDVAIQWWGSRSLNSFQSSIRKSVQIFGERERRWRRRLSLKYQRITGCDRPDPSPIAY